MNVLVTGASGFLGSHLCDLLSKKEFNVYSLARNKNKMESFRVPGEFIQGELSTNDKNKWLGKLPENLDVVIHSAGVVHSFEKDTFYNINTLGTQQLFKDLKNKYSSLHFIFISSLSAAGPASMDPRTEKDQEKPVSHYGHSKLKAEYFLQKEVPSNWSLTIVRPPMIIGPRDTGVLDVFKMVKGGIVLNAGMNSGPKNYSFICVYDLTNSILSLMKKKSGHKEIFFISHDHIISYKELIQEIKKVCQKKFLINLRIPLLFVKYLANIFEWAHKRFSFDFRLTPDKVSEVGPTNWTCSPKKAKNHFDLKTQWSLKDTLEKTYEDYKKRKWI